VTSFQSYHITKAFKDCPFSSKTCLQFLLILFNDFNPKASHHQVIHNHKIEVRSKNKKQYRHDSIQTHTKKIKHESTQTSKRIKNLKITKNIVCFPTIKAAN